MRVQSGRCKRGATPPYPSIITGVANPTAAVQVPYAGSFSTTNTYIYTFQRLPLIINPTSEPVPSSDSLDLMRDMDPSSEIVHEKQALLHVRKLSSLTAGSCCSCRRTRPLRTRRVSREQVPVLPEPKPKAHACPTTDPRTDNLEPNMRFASMRYFLGSPPLDPPLVLSSLSVLPHLTSFPFLLPISSRY